MNNPEIQILLVDDDEDDYILVSKLLANIPYWTIDLDWAPSSQSAIEKTEKGDYDICFVDHQLDEINGIELMHRMINQGFSGPIVIVTGRGSRDIDITAMIGGASDYIEKSNLKTDVFERCIRYNIERHRVMNQLKNTQGRLRKLSEKLIDAQEQERQLIAQELHDSIGSSLTAIKFALESKLDTENDTPTNAQGITVEKIISMVDETIDENRRISAKLRPSILDDLGLVQTLGWECRNFESLYPGIRIQKNFSVEESDVPESLKIVIYRILQEALNNTAKHSGADAVELSLKTVDSKLILEIRDNGTGFDVEHVEAVDKIDGGMGLEGMQDRAEFTNGRFEINSQKQQGTIIRIWWPTNPNPTGSHNS